LVVVLVAHTGRVLLNALGKTVDQAVAVIEMEEAVRLVEQELLVKAVMEALDLLV
jgi:hypothetical protein